MKGAAQVGRAAPWTFRVGADVAAAIELARQLAHLDPPAAVEFVGTECGDGGVHAELAQLRLAVDGWRAGRVASRFTLGPDGDGAVRLTDTRGGGPGCDRVLFGWRAAVYVHCERARTADEVAALPELDGLGRVALAGFLAWCVDRELMIEQGGRYLALAIPPR